MLSLWVPLQFHTSESEAKLGLRAAWLSVEGVHNSSSGVLNRDQKLLLHNTAYHYPAIERNKAPNYATPQINLENTTLNERSQSQKALSIRCIEMEYPG